MYEELVYALKKCGYPGDVHCCRDCVFANDGGTCHRKKLLPAAADAIEELQKDLERSKDFEAFWQHEAEEALKKFQVDIANKPQWIPVTERLPYMFEEVLVSTEGYGETGLGFATVAVFDGTGWLEAWERKTYLTAVTHWIPIPDRQKEGE